MTQDGLISVDPSFLNLTHYAMTKKKKMTKEEKMKLKAE